MSLEMKKSPMRIKDVISMTNGFFNHIPYTFPEDITKSSLDIQFFSNYSLRAIAPIVSLFNDGVSQLTNESLDTIGWAIFETYHHKWDKQLAVYNIEYNPIYNYKDEFHETNSIESTDEKSDTWSESGDNLRVDNVLITIGKGVSQLTTRTDNLTEEKTLGTELNQTRTDNLSKLTTNDLTENHSGNITENSTRTDNLSQLETRDLTQINDDTGNDNLFGYNSPTAVGDTTNTSKSTTSDDGTVTTANTGTQQNNKTTEDSRGVTNSGTVKVDDSGTQKIVTANTGTDRLVNTGTQQTNVVNSGEDITKNSGSQKNTKSEHGTKTQNDEYVNNGKRDYEHVGNIGNHPTQQLINDEIELWRWNFVQEILNDVKEFTTIPVYLC